MICFQTTYEELKQLHISLYGGDEGSFQTTYEELKHVFGGSRRLYHECFQTTYEELKPDTTEAENPSMRELPDYL